MELAKVRHGALCRASSCRCPQMARGLRCIFGALSRAPGERWRMHLGPQILLEAGGLLLGTAELLRRMRRRQVHQALRGAAHAVVPAKQRGNVHGQPLDEGGVPPVGRHAAPPPQGRRLRMWRQWQDGTRCAANMAADGRRVVGGGRGTCCGTCETVRTHQGRNLTVLHAAAAVESRENLLRRMPRHLCIKINPAIRLISSSCAHPYLGRLYILSENIIALGGTFPAI